MFLKRLFLKRPFLKRPSSPRQALLLGMLVIGLLVGGPILAAEKAGVSMPDTFDMDGTALVLNGLGLREATALKVDVYVAGLYLPTKQTDAEAILASGDPWRIHMKFVRKVGKKSITDAWSTGFKKNVKGHADMKAKIAELNGMMDRVAKGDTMTFQFVPGTGLTVEINGTAKGTVAGDAFGRGMLAVFLGRKPPNAGLKKGLLGN